MTSSSRLRFVSSCWCYRRRQVTLFSLLVFINVVEVMSVWATTLSISSESWSQRHSSLLSSTLVIVIIVDRGHHRPLSTSLSTLDVVVVTISGVRRVVVVIPSAAFRMRATTACLRTTCSRLPFEGPVGIVSFVMSLVYCHWSISLRRRREVLAGCGVVVVGVLT